MTVAFGFACQGDRRALDEASGGAMRPGGLGLTARALRYCALGAGARVLDLGCGTGVTVEYLRGSLALDALGVDSSWEALERSSRRNAALPLLQGSGNDLPLASGSVAAVLAECSLSLMPERGRVLAECWRVLAPVGRLAMTDLYAREPRAMALLRSLPLACGAAMATREELASQLEDQGFRVEIWEDHSPALTEFAFRLIMAGGSLQKAWVRPGASPDEEGRIADAVRSARPGYCLLVARKRREARRGTQDVEGGAA